MNEELQPHVEAFDASFGTDKDHARDVRGTYSAHPDDPPIVPARTAAEQAEIDAKREEARLREQRALESDPEIQLLLAQLKDAPRDARGHVIPRNDGAYRNLHAVDARVRELEAQGFDHTHALAIVRDEIAAAAVEESPEKAHYSPNDRRYLGTSVRSLMSAGGTRATAAPPGAASISPDQTRLEQGSVSATGKVLDGPCHACSYQNAVDAWICQQCGAQLRAASRRGPAPSPDSKHAFVGARISAAAKAGLKARGNASDEIEILGLALATSRAFEDVRRMTPEQRETLRREAETLHADDGVQ